MSNNQHPSVGKVNAVVEGLGWIYDKVSSNISAVTGSATEAEIDQWIRVACAGAGAVGFASNLGGVFTLPVAIPVNLAAAASIQLGLAARIVVARGYDPSDPQVKTFAIACMLGAKAGGILAAAGAAAGGKLAGAAVAAIPGAALIAINKAVGIRLLTKMGQQGVVNFGKLIPVAGALVGGTIDAAGTYAAGRAAKLMFPRLPLAPLGTTTPAPAPVTPRPRLVIAGIKST